MLEHPDLSLSITFSREKAEIVLASMKEEVPLTPDKIIQSLLFTVDELCQRSGQSTREVLEHFLEEGVPFRSQEAEEN